MTRIVCIGEGMLELSRHAGDWRMHYGGDVLNTAIHLARRGVDVALLTALGDDPFSDLLRSQWADEGLDTALILTHPARQPGLYAVTTDATGERSFSYWRDTSAARDLLSLPGVEATLEEAALADCLYFSLISLAILPDEARRAVLAFARLVRDRGGVVAFDGNYRARLWPDATTAAHWRDAAIAVSTIGFPTLDDEVAIDGVRSAEAIGAHWAALGCSEVVVKLGPSGCVVHGGDRVAPARCLNPIDTSGAGDAFNAAYLERRLAGDDSYAAARAGHELAGRVIMRPGAIPPLDDTENTDAATEMAQTN